MFSLTADHRFFLYKPPTDMRKSFDGLMGLVQNKLNHSPASGDVFVFINKRGDRVKLLHWEVGGFVIYYKRLEAGTLELPESPDNTTAVSWSQLIMIIEGISLKDIEKRRRFSSAKSGKKGL